MNYLHTANIMQYARCIGILLLVVFAVFGCRESEVSNEQHKPTRRESTSIVDKDSIKPIQTKQDTTNQKPDSVFAKARIRLKGSDLILHLYVTNKSSSDVILVPTMSIAARRKDANLRSTRGSMGMHVHYWCDGEKDPRFSIYEPWPTRYKPRINIQFISIPNNTSRELIYYYHVDCIRTDRPPCVLRAEIIGFPYWYSSNATVQSLLPEGLVKNRKRYHLKFPGKDAPEDFRVWHYVEETRRAVYMTEEVYFILRKSQMWIVPEMIK